MAEQILDRLLQGDHRDQADVWVEVDEEVDIAGSGVVAADHAAEDAHVGCAVRLGEFDNCLSVRPHGRAGGTTVGASAGAVSRLTVRIPTELRRRPSS